MGIVSELDALDPGFRPIPVTSVFTSSALAGDPFQEENGARVLSFFTNATQAYRGRFVYTINYYPFWDPAAKLDAGTADKCKESIAWATSFGANGSVPSSLRLTR